MASLHEHILNHKWKIDKESLAKISEEAPNDLLFLQQNELYNEISNCSHKILARENKTRLKLSSNAKIWWEPF